MDRSKQGFTLIELVIVAAILAILVALAIPALRRSMMNANEAAAIGAIRVIAAAQLSFHVATLLDANRDGVGEFGTLAQLGGPSIGASEGPGASGGRGGSRGRSGRRGGGRGGGLGGGAGNSGASPPFIDSVLATGVKQGYLFTVEPSTGPGGTPRYTAHAIPETPGKTGVRTFFVDETGLIRSTNNGDAASAHSPPLN